MAPATDSTDDAFALAKSDYETTKNAAASAGLTLVSYEFTVMHDGAAVEMYPSTVGVSYTAIINGETVS